jgi:MoaA/NifB/PqqE/SkfB family radical SAM enzyme
MSGNLPESTFQRIEKMAIDKRIPIYGSIEITDRCNLQCVQCYIPMRNRKAATDGLTYNETTILLDQIAQEGCLFLLITGGEPLLRKDFLDIYAYAKKSGFIINLFTNGTLLTPEIADFLEEWPPNVVEITLYGSTKETYERVTGVPGSFERCRMGINLLIERDVALNLKTTLTTLNKHELWDMKQIAMRLGLRYRFDGVLVPSLDHSKAPCDFRLSPEEIVKLDLIDDQRNVGWKEVVSKYNRRLIPEDSFYRCGAGVYSFHINSRGMLDMCIASQALSYDLRHGPFEKGWKRLCEIHSRKPSSKYVCGECDKAFLCTNCPPRAWIENRDEEAVVEYYCRIANLRAGEFRHQKSES